MPAGSPVVRAQGLGEYRYFRHYTLSFESQLAYNATGQSIYMIKLGQYAKPILYGRHFTLKTFCITYFPPDLQALEPGLHTTVLDKLKAP